MIKFQGEDIPFRLIYKIGETVNISNWSGFQQIIAYFYTDGCEIIKFSSIVRDGYSLLELANPITYSGIIKSSDSKILAPGFLTIEIKGVVNNDEKCIDKQLTGICIQRNFIKNS